MTTLTFYGGAGEVGGKVWADCYVDRVEDLMEVVKNG